MKKESIRRILLLVWVNLFSIIAAQTDSNSNHLTSQTTGRLTFEGLLALAIKNDAQLAQIEAQRKMAQGKTVQAGLWPNPRLRYHLSDYNLDQSSSATEEHSFRLTQPLPIGRRLYRGIQAGKAEEKHFEAQLRQREFDLTGELRSAWRLAQYDLRADEEMQRLLRELEEDHRTARIRFEVGGGPLLDVNNVEWEMQDMRREIWKAKEEVNENLALLENLTGIRIVPNQLFQEAETGPSENSSTSESQIAYWEARRGWVENEHPAIIAALSAIETKNRELTLTKAERIPDIELGGGLGHARSTGEDELEILVSVDVPIFDRKQGDIKEAEGAIEEAQEDVRAARAELLFLFGEAQMRFRNAVERNNYMQRSAVPQNESAYEKIALRFGEEATTFDDLFDAHRALLRSRIEAIKAGREHLRAELDLFRLAGDAPV